MAYLRHHLSAISHSLFEQNKPTLSYVTLKVSKTMLLKGRRSRGDAQKSGLKGTARRKANSLKHRQPSVSAGPASTGSPNRALETFKKKVRLLLTCAVYPGLRRRHLYRLSVLSLVPKQHGITSYTALTLH